MEVAFVAAEAVPFAKTGGLADVIGTLPPALERADHRVRVILPAYRTAFEARTPIEGTELTVLVPVGSKLVEGRLLRSTLPRSDVEILLIDCPAYFDREGVYQSRGADFPDNDERFIFFARAALEVLARLGRRVDLIHGHDWPAGLVPAYLDEHYRRHHELAAAGTLTTIHNLAYQGAFEPAAMSLTGLDPRLFNDRQLEAYGRLNFLKAGLVFGDMLSTVSPTYAQEILDPKAGWGLDGLLRSRSADLSGIVNGIDPAAWNPATDTHLAANYTVDDFAAGKAVCKADLQRLAGLEVRPDVPLLAQIGRLDPQKGWDLLAGVADELLRSDVQLVVLGVGHPRYHDLLDQLASRHPGRLRVFLEFSDDLAHRIEAGADIFLMPSLYEPCGLNQLYSLAYGTVPVVRQTGGLADTVVDARPDTLADGTANGFSFREPTPEALRGAIDRALSARHDRPLWARLIRAGMRADWSWDRSARAYGDLYREVAGRRDARAVG